MAEDVQRLAGQNVKRPRIAAGLSQAELAARTGVDRAYVSGLELGQRNPTVVTGSVVPRWFRSLRVRGAISAAMKTYFAISIA
jgi:predicted transcriptional regulator